MSKFLIGEIVSFQSHPFSKVTTEVIISGEYQMIPPLMIIVEIMSKKDSDASLDENKYKCLWFSSKTNQFKESYFLETDLKTIVRPDLEFSHIKKGALVSLSSADLELGKKRSFMISEVNKLATKSSQSMAGLLTFISPVMLVIELDDFEVSKGKTAIVSDKVYTTYPTKVAKCKWYDSVTEKFSEKWLPLDTLSEHIIISEDLLNFIQSAINNNTYILLDTTIIQPSQISNRSGVYFLNFFDYVLQQYQTINLKDISKLDNVTTPYIKRAPLFKEKGRKSKRALKLVVTVEDLFEAEIASKVKHFITIKYLDQYHNLTTRTISNYRFLIGDDIDDLFGAKVKYVVAFCHLRQNERNFKLSSIIEANLLNLTF
jgi:uncharacterized protein YodC (DUF2158 family)